jgi:hypothetical protein
MLLPSMLLPAVRRRTARVLASAVRFGTITNHDGWSETRLDGAKVNDRPPASNALKHGHSILLFHGLASEEECDALRREALAAAKARQCREDVPFGRTNSNAATGVVRMPVDYMLNADGAALCETIFRRVISRLDREPTLRVQDAA